MPLYRCGQKVVLFVHVPKTGGSTVEEVLKAAGAAQALKYHKRLGFSNCTPQHMPWEVLRHWVPKGFYDAAFTLVRAPLARLASEYRWRRSLTEGALPAFDRWVPKVLRRYPDDPWVHDNHMRPQAEFTGPGLEVFRLEDGLAAPVRFGLEALGLGEAAPAIHHARRGAQDELALSAASLRLAQEFYAIDYTTFGYDPRQDRPDGLRLPE